MKHFFLFLVLSLVAIASGCKEDKEDFSNLIYGPRFPVRHFDFEREYVFSTMNMELKNVILHRSGKRFKVRNNFCAIGYVFPPTALKPERKEVIVFWEEDEIIFRWDGGDPEAAKEDFYYASTLFHSPNISFDSSLVESKDEPLGNGDFAYREDVENLLADCEKHGKKYTVEPFTPPQNRHGEVPDWVYRVKE